MYLEGYHLNGVSMLALLATVGISVNYTIHVCYLFFTVRLPYDADIEDKIERMR